jgi:hypothetical protein
MTKFLVDDGLPVWLGYITKLNKKPPFTDQCTETSGEQFPKWGSKRRIRHRL